MKNLIIISILFSNFIVVGQGLIFDECFFKNKLNNIKISNSHFTAFESLPLYKHQNVHEQSILFSLPENFVYPYNRVQPINYKMKKIPYSINYEQDFRQCGPLQLRDSEDMMVGAIIDYVFNKYVVGLFLPTPYDD